jgi:ribosomal protein S21
MVIIVKKKEGESAGSLIFRFGKKIQQSGIIQEVKKRRFKKRNVNKRSERTAALYKVRKKKDIEKKKKLGLM